ncbi:MAG: ribosome biogenesis GTP-binding protein YihA/YsxC [Cytophagaceae bacterium]
MNITKSSFITSKKNYKESPAPDKFEIAFIGRSNVGKSSLINMLAGHKGLAKTSSRPGKTQLINHFLINNEMYWVDLPGYGWARVSKENRENWEKMVKDYILYRENLYCLFVLIDSRLEPQKIDIDFINWLGEKGVPFAIVYTKADKLSRSQTLASTQRFNKELSKFWQELPVTFVTSSETGEGKNELLDYIQEIFENYREQNH